MKREVQIALLAIITLALSFWGFKFLGGNNLFSGDKIYYAIFENVKDVNTATPVLINGYQVGTVISIIPEEDNIANIKVGFQVKKDIRVPKDAVVELRSASPLGGKELELVFVKMCEDDDCAEAKSVLEGRTLGLVGSLIESNELDPHLESFSNTFNETLGRLGNADSEAPIDKAILNMSRTMESLAKSTQQFEQLMEKSSKNMERTMQNMASLSSALIASNEKLASILENVDLITEDMTKSSLSETINNTNATMEQAASSLESLEQTMSDASTTLNELNGVLQKVSSDEGSIGSMLNNKELYNNIEETTRNLNLLLQDMRLNPRRYFRLFGKKSPDYVFPEEDPSVEGK